MTETTTTDAATWQAFAEHARELLVRGYRLRLTMSNGKAMRAWVEGDAVVMSPVDADDWAAGTVEPVCGIDADYLVEWLTGARIDEREEPEGGALPVIVPEGGRHRTECYVREWIEFDEKDEAIVREAITNRLERREVLVGDWVRFPGDEWRRVSNVCHDGGVQTSRGGSYYLHSGGGASMSGSLDRPVPGDSLVALTTVKLARFWIFHHGIGGGSRGLGFRVPVRVWACVDPAPTS